jgi:hypothetical protein
MTSCKALSKEFFTRFRRTFVVGIHVNQRPESLPMCFGAEKTALRRRVNNAYFSLLATIFPCRTRCFLPPDSHNCRDMPRLPCICHPDYASRHRGWKQGLELYSILPATRSTIISCILQCDCSASSYHPSILPVILKDAFFFFLKYLKKEKKPSCGHRRSMLTSLD